MFDESNFFDDNGAGFLNHDGNNAATSSEAPKNRNKRNLVAVNVDILNNDFSLRDGLVIHNQKITSVTIVGRVEQLVEQTTSLSFMLRDDCGPPVEVIAWKLQDNKEEDASAAYQNINESSLVRIYGQVRSKEGKVYISAFKVVPIMDMNEIGLHKVEVVYHLKMLERMKHNQEVFDDVNDELTANDAASVNTAATGGLMQIHSLILQEILSDDTPEGISLDDIILSMPTLDKERLQQALNFLLVEGHIYTTVDDTHFKATCM